MVQVVLFVGGKYSKKYIFLTFIKSVPFLISDLLEKCKKWSNFTAI